MAIPHILPENKIQKLTIIKLKHPILFKSHSDGSYMPTRSMMMVEGLVYKQ